MFVTEPHKKGWTDFDKIWYGGTLDPRLTYSNSNILLQIINHPYSWLG